MGKVGQPFELAELETKPPLSTNPSITDDIQQTLATLVGFDGVQRKLIRVTPTGILQVVNPLIKGILNLGGFAATYNYQGPDIKCSEIVVRAGGSNGGDVWVNIGSAAAVDTGWPLDANEYVPLTIINLQHLHLHIVDAADKVQVLYTQ